MSKKKVLLVDDNPSLRAAMKFILLKMNCDFYEAVDGEDGVNKAKEILPDLIIMDFLMPKMNGWDATKELKSNDSTKNIPVIGYTDYANKDHIMKGKAAGCSEIIKKPLDIEAMKIKFRPYLND